MQGLSGRPVAVSRPCLSPSLHPFPALTVQCWLKRICSFLLEHPNILIHRSVISSIVGTQNLISFQICLSVASPAGHCPGETFDPENITSHLYCQNQQVQRGGGTCGDALIS